MSADGPTLDDMLAALGWRQDILDCVRCARDIATDTLAVDPPGSRFGRFTVPGMPSLGAASFATFDDAVTAAWRERFGATAPPAAPVSGVDVGAIRGRMGSPGIYVASRASVPERPAMWRAFRDEGFPIVSTWIDEAGPGESPSMADLWRRCTEETRAPALVLHAPPEDGPWKGAFIEAGMVLGRGGRVFIAGPHAHLGSWVWAPGICICADPRDALNQALAFVQAGGMSQADEDRRTLLSELDRLTTRVRELEGETGQVRVGGPAWHALGPVGKPIPVNTDVLTCGGSGGVRVRRLREIRGPDGSPTLAWYDADGDYDDGAEEWPPTHWTYLPPTSGASDV
jgi:hypothetical protein